MITRLQLCHSELVLMTDPLKSLQGQKPCVFLSGNGWPNPDLTLEPQKEIKSLRKDEGKRFRSILLEGRRQGPQMCPRKPSQ